MRNLIFLILLATSFSALAALPPQFSECIRDNSGTTMSIYDLREIAKISKVTVCQNQLGLLSKYDTMDLLRNGNVQAGISLAKTSYLKEDFVEMARAGTYLLYVDNQELDRFALVDLLKAKVQLVVISAQAGLAREDLLAMAAAGPFVLNVNSVLLKEDLKRYIAAGVQVVLRTGQAGLSREDIIEVAKASQDLVTIMP